MNEPGAIELDRDGVLVSGPDAGSFLQGQLSQDVLGLEPDASAWSLLLEPTGRMVAQVRATRTGHEQFLLDLDAGHGAAVIDRLRRFLIRVACTVESEPLTLLAVRGPGAASVGGTATVRHDPGWPGIEGLDLVGQAVVRPDGLSELPAEEFRRRRILAGIPAMGREITADVIPAELGVVEGSVDFTKGCYTGQELVARIDARGGNVPRRLRVIEVPGGHAPEGAAVWCDGVESGRLSSAAPDSAGTIALGLLHRRVEAPSAVTVRWTDHETPAVARAVPSAG